MDETIYDVLVIGSINLDLVVSAARIPLPGETIHGTNFATAFGGKGANQAVAAARMGNRVKMLAAIGSDANAALLLESLNTEGIDTSLVKSVEGPSGTALITVDTSGQNSIVVVAGANAHIRCSDLENMHWKESRVLLCQLEIPLKTVTQALRQGHGSGCFTILNPAPAVELPADIAPFVDLITPNKTEAELLTGETDPAKAAEHLHEIGYARVIITLDKTGLLYSEKAKQEYHPAYTVKAVDTTAAGDAFSGALAGCLSQNADVRSAIPQAMACAALAVTKPGAQVSLPRKDEVAAFLGALEE